MYLFWRYIEKNIKKKQKLAFTRDHVFAAIMESL